MKRLMAVLILSWRFARSVVASALATARVILREPSAPRRGFATLHYGELSEGGAVLLGALVTLTPGTSTLDIDLDAHQLRLHVLDTADLDATLAAIRHGILQPLQVLFGESS